MGPTLLAWLNCSSSQRLLWETQIIFVFHIPTHLKLIFFLCQQRVEIHKLRQGENLILGFSIGGGIDQDPSQNPFSEDKTDKVRGPSSWGLTVGHRGLRWWVSAFLGLCEGELTSLKHF